MPLGDDLLMGGPTAHVSLNYWRKKQNTIASTCSMYLTNQQQFSMLCTIINHRNDIIIFKTQVKPFWHHWLSLWSITVQTIEHFCWFVFYNNIRSFDLHFCWKFLASCLTCEKEKSKLCHHVILMVCTLIKCRFPPINAQEIGQLL